jgi:hypothetical protein
MRREDARATWAFWLTCEVLDEFEELEDRGREKW